MNESKFTPTAEEALQLAQEAAGELGHGYMGTEHLLLGLMREDEGIAHTVLEEAGLTDDLLTEMIRKSAGAGASGSGGTAQELSPRAKHVLEIAMEDAARGGYAYIGTEHLLAGDSGIGLAVGLSLGVLFEIVMDDIGLGMMTGVAVGLCVGPAVGVLRQNRKSEEQADNDETQ